MVGARTGAVLGAGGAAVAVAVAAAGVAAVGGSARENRGALNNAPAPSARAQVVAARVRGVRMGAYSTAGRGDVQGVLRAIEARNAARQSARRGASRRRE